MRRTLFALALAALALTAGARERHYETVAGDATATRIYRLDNGLTVYLSVNKEKPRLQANIAVRTGSRNDPAETTGLAHYLEHIMFKGTTHFGTVDYAKEEPLLAQIEQQYEVYRRTTDPAERTQRYHVIDSLSQEAAKYFVPNEYDKLMSGIGAEGTNAYTSNDVTCYTENIPNNEIEAWAKIQADRFQNMVIRGFHTELEAVYEEFNMGLASDGRKEWEAFMKKLFPTHPYGTQSTIGTQEHLKNPSTTNIKNYFRRYYVPNNVAICLAGDFEPDTVMDIIERYFGPWRASEGVHAPQYAPVRPLTAPADTAVVGKEAENTILGWAFAGANSAQADTIAVLADVLSNGKAGLMDLDLDQKMRYLGGGAYAESLAEYSCLMLQGAPKEGQTLEEVRDLLLAEIEKVKQGDFDDDLLQAVVNNMKLSYYNSLESNERRVSMYVDAFINQQPWADAVRRIDRMAGITRQQLADFARRHLGSGYAIVYKRKGEDNSQKKIDKPAITAIPANRDLQSDFVREMLAQTPAPIEPRFVDYDKDLNRAVTKHGLHVLHVQNTENGRFQLAFRYKFGNTAMPLLTDAAMYLNYLGTDKLTAEQIKKQFYKLACNYNVGVNAEETTVSLSGLAENMPAAIALLEDFMQHAKVDKAAYDEALALLKKSRDDEKLNQRSNFNALRAYATQGAYNPWRNQTSIAELEKTDPQQLLDLLSSLRGMAHEVLYYGPLTAQQLCAVIDKQHKTPKKLAPVPANKPYQQQLTPTADVYLAPYEAKNIYMVQYHNAGRTWDPQTLALTEVFNEYFGGGMNTIVFQELREARGLAYSAGASYSTPAKKENKETVSTFIITQNDKMTDCMRTFNEIIDTMPQSQRAFDLAKQAVEKRLRTQRTTKFGIINSYLSAQRLGLTTSPARLAYDGLGAVTMERMAAFERETMAAKPWRYIVLGNEKELDMPALEKIGTIRRLTTEEIFGY